jgi:serine protease Do
MFVPVDLLPPSCPSCSRAVAREQSDRAWMGVNCVEMDGRVRVVRVTEDSPADVAGLEVGDQILRLDGQAVTGLESLWKTLWKGTAAERAVELRSCAAA